MGDEEDGRIRGALVGGRKDRNAEEVKEVSTYAWVLLNLPFLYDKQAG